MRYNFEFSYTFCFKFCKTKLSQLQSSGKKLLHILITFRWMKLFFLKDYCEEEEEDYFGEEEEEEEDKEAEKEPAKRKCGRPRKGEVVVKPIKQRRRGPQKEEDEYKLSSEYNRPTKTTLERNRKRRSARHNCILCGEEVVTSNIVRHLSLSHCYPLKLRSYILDVTRIRHQQQGKHPIINDCTTCLRRFVVTRAHRHHSIDCVLTEVPDFTSLDGLCLRAKAIMAVCDGDLNNAFELLKEELGRD